MTGEVRSPHEASLQLREVLQVATARTMTTTTSCRLNWRRSATIGRHTGLGPPKRSRSEIACTTSRY